ncbi:MAG: hypothetical protein IKP90_08340 [Fibrobacter sp.]|nr:hypothetical protein [Fibrobacter sp.]
MGRKKKKFWDYAGAALYFLPDVAKQTLLPDWLHDQFKKTVIKSIVKLIICIFAVYVAIFKSIGELYSLWMSSLLFIGMMLWSIVEPVLKFYMLPVMIMRKRSLRVGIVEFVKYKNSKVALGSYIYEKTRVWGLRFSSVFQVLRSSDEILWDFIIYLAKNAITFVSIFSLYILLVHWIFKPIILEKFAGLTTMQIYLFPIRQFL